MSAEAPLRSEPLLLRLIAGPSRWGRLDVWPSRYGFTRYRLTVLPPGASAGERGWFALWRACPALGAVLGFGTDLTLLSAGAGGGVAAAAGAAAVLVLVALVAVRTRRLRPLVRVRVGGVDDVVGYPCAVGDMDAIDRWWAVLAAADRAEEDGAMSRVEHELVWGAAWDGLAPAPRAPHAGIRDRAAALLRQA